MKTIDVLIACEFSGIVREAFRAYHGINAISCDYLPPEDGRWDYHYLGDAREAIKYNKWGAMIFFAPCTFLANSGVCWLYKPDGKRDEERWENMRLGAELYRDLLHADIPLIAGENPIPHRYALEIIGRKYDQIIQPWQFWPGPTGQGETKATCLWLKGLPRLIPTTPDETGRIPRVHYEPPGPERWKNRSRTYPGIAAAMAEQWTPIILGGT